MNRAAARASSRFRSLRLVREADADPDDSPEQKGDDEAAAHGALRSLSALLPLKLFRDRARGLPDLLPYAALLTPQVVLLKSGGLMCCMAYAGRDTESSTPDEINGLSRICNRVLSGLGSGWATYHDAVRRQTSKYLGGLSHFPDAVSRQIDENRRRYFETQGESFETYYVLSFVWLPPHIHQQRLTELMYTDDAGDQQASTADQNLAVFEHRVETIVDQLSAFLRLRLLGSVTVSDAGGREVEQSELLQYLNYAVSGFNHPVNVPAAAMYLDSLIGAYDYFTGVFPKVDEHFMAVISIEGFPAESYPTILETLCDLPLVYRWTNRFLYLDPPEAARELKNYRRKWKQKERGMKDQLFNEHQGPLDLDALQMGDDVNEALREVSGATVAYGFFSATVILLSTDRHELNRHARDVRRQISNLGFVARLETTNADHAYLGSLPGNVEFNVRRPFISTRVLSDFVPLSSIWAGLPMAPNPMFPGKSPALLQCRARGSTPFRLNLHVGDVGHTLILGPTGAGKSTLLALIQAQARRYKGAQIYCFDKGYSAMALCHGAGGLHYDIGSDESPIDFCPLRAIDTTADLAWAAGWVETLITLQGIEVNPGHRQTILDALRLLRDSPTRALTEFRANLQDQQLREAIAPYTLDGKLGALLDAEEDLLRTGHYTVFEIESLMEMGQASLVPVLLYLFRVIERRLTGAPSFLILDEAWVALGHPVFREKIREWLKTLRKANCAVILATQQLSDLQGSGIADVIVESCPVKILLPNPEAASVGSARLYRDLLSLNDAQLALLAMATPKRQYYFMSAEGRRLFELGLDEYALAWCAVSGREARGRLLRCMEQHGANDWRHAWVRDSQVA